MPNQVPRKVLQYNMRRTTVLCWRCWKSYFIYSPGEFADAQILYCDQCSTSRICEDADVYWANKKFLDRRFPSVRGWGSKREHSAFMTVFEREWSEPCECGGRFRLNPWPKCPHCHAKPWPLLSRTTRDVVPAPPIPVLKFAIPPEYLNAPGRPPLNPGEPKVAFIPGPLPQPINTYYRQQGQQEPRESMEAFEERILALTQERLGVFASRFKDAAITIDLGPLKWEETETIRYSSEYPLIVKKRRKVTETISVCIFGAGERLTDEVSFVNWLDRMLERICAGETVSKLREFR